MSEKAWTVRNSQYALNDQWVRVRADECTTPSGIDVSPYYVFEFPDFVHVLAFDDADQIILVRQYRHGFGDLSLELPGGVLDAGDQNIIAAAKRELQEETGYLGAQYEVIKTLSVDPARYANRLHLVSALDVKLGVANPEPSEDIEVVRLPQSEALRLALSGGIVNAQHVGLLMIGLSAAKRL